MVYSFNEELHPEKYLLVKMTDMIDFCLVLIEKGVELDILDYFIEIFPEELSQTDIDLYFDRFSFLSQKQEKELYKKAQKLLLFKPLRWFR